MGPFGCGSKADAPQLDVWVHEAIEPFEFKVLREGGRSIRPIKPVRLT